MSATPDVAGAKPGFDAIVLAGGAATRLGGVDKALLEVGGATMLDRVLDAVTGATTIVCVGPRKPTSIPVTWTREDPPGGGPAAAVAAGLDAVREPVVVVLAVDVPLVTRDLVGSLVTTVTPGGDEAAMAIDAHGVPQPLIAAYDARRLRKLVGSSTSVHGLAIGKLVEPMRTTLVDARGVAADCDTWEELESLREVVGGA